MHNYQFTFKNQTTKTFKNIIEIQDEITRSKLISKDKIEYIWNENIIAVKMVK